MKKSLCCISLELQKSGRRASTMTKTRFLALERTKALSILSSRVVNNLDLTHDTIKHCIANNWNYRISSSLFPLATLPDANLSFDVLPDKALINATFADIAQTIANNSIRCSMHPDQFVVPASANPSVAAKSLVELEHHALLMDRMGLPRSYNAPINIHMNCFKGSLPDIAKRFIEAYKTLSEGVQSRLVLENEDKPNSWNVEQLYEHIHQRIGIPITYDNLHHKCNPGHLSAKNAVALAMSSWGKYRPLFHYSESRGEFGIDKRSHRDTPLKFPVEFVDLDVDLEFEFKLKDYAINFFEMVIENHVLFQEGTKPNKFSDAYVQMAKNCHEYLLRELPLEN